MIGHDFGLKMARFTVACVDNVALVVTRKQDDLDEDLPLLCDVHPFQNEIRYAFWWKQILVGVLHLPNDVKCLPKSWKSWKVRPPTFFITLK
jgi:hypothetical protein